MKTYRDDNFNLFQIYFKVEETELVEHIFFTDLNFSHDRRVSQIRWHPFLEGVVAMAVVENTVYEEYLNNLTKR